MTRLTDAQFLELAVQCLEHARQSTAIRDCQCHACKGFMQQSGELIDDIKKRPTQETRPECPDGNHDWMPMSNPMAPVQERICAKCTKYERAELNRGESL